ncbi:phage major capsid protein [Streptococcus anginosus]|jgi:HK97 family phage major capsid protein|uniref:phage major capsid protein n=1 Tax=Streptococcus anginosus TaxID=1328 RepID=UPI000FEFE805|nr:phage major capsid protein [Streptococcus anginosus]DAL38983.1 MAG TPA_asm: major capsid protein [Caudoviricetes sp.]KAA9324782.1 phage major capsid protein [Streptococcus anginosus]MCW1021612.1 phage major capsid protein [Streptococcus anginosus]MCW1057623.1 phage major capsid protein [Streptococcus anginosus]MED5837023.1 phage major capsid protein [Streptococcus anginosus]
MDINTLNALWIEAGHKVEDLNEQINNALNDDSFTAEAFEELKNKRDTAKVRRDALKDQLVEAQAQAVVDMKDEDVKPLNENEETAKNVFIKDFKNLLNGTYRNAAVGSKEDDGTNAGLTIPKDIQTAIHALVRQYNSLQEYVTVESVSTTSGSRVYEKWSDITALANLDDENTAITDIDAPKLALIKYAIKRYAGMLTATNSLLKDTVENILAWLNQWVAKKVVVTRNKAILEKIAALPSKPNITKFDDIKDLALKGVDPAIRSTSFFMTNTSGLATLAKVKNAMGDYLLQRDPTQPERYLLEGKQVIEIADRWLADNAGAHPLYFGDLKQAVTLFDREHMSIEASNVAGDAFSLDQTKIRVIDRFDVVTTDSEAFVAASFKTIADQEANIKSKE